MNNTQHLPNKNEYQRLLQNPKVYLNIPKFKEMSIESDGFGLPRVRSGGFALTYKLNSGNQEWALRCFHKYVPDREIRYKSICDHLSRIKSKHFIEIEFFQDGLIFNENYYPVTLMKWVNGDTLGTYIYENCENKELISNLILQFESLSSEIARLEIAHGDLSNQNIIVDNRKLILVDYDGMYVPSLKKLKSRELGNPNFQHPGRSESHYNSNIDRFSILVIYLALQSIYYSPEMGRKYLSGEGLLFSRNDFLYPYQSTIINEIEKIPQLSSLIKKFRNICLSSADSTPNLIDFKSDKPFDLGQRFEKLTTLDTSQGFSIISSSDNKKLMENVDNFVTVIGKTFSSYRGLTKSNKPYVFLNFGDYKKNCFTVVIWSETLELLQKYGKKSNNLNNQWISVSGIISIYKNNYGERLQIILESPADLRIISADEADLRISQLGNTQKTTISSSCQDEEIYQIPSANLNTIHNKNINSLYNDFDKFSDNIKKRNSKNQKSLDSNLSFPKRKDLLDKLDKLYSSNQATPSIKTPLRSISSMKNNLNSEMTKEPIKNRSKNNKHKHISFFRKILDWFDS